MASKHMNPANGENQQTKSHVSTRVISGSVGAILTSLAVTPLEVAKVRTQLQPSQTGLCPRGCGKQVVLFNGHIDCFVSPKSMLPLAEPQHRDGVFSVLRRIFAKEGFRGLYAGLEPTLVMSIPNTVLYFSAYDEIIWRLRESSSPPTLSWTYPLVAGASARLVASSVTSPFEFLRTRQATEQGQVASQGLWRDMRTIIRKEGFGTLYSGLRPTLYRDVPFSALYWFCLEEFRLYWRETQQPATPTPLEQAGQAFLNGAVSGMIAAACTTPFDVVKTLQQTNGVQQQPRQRPPVTPPVQLSFCKHDGAMVYEPPPNKPNASSSTTLAVMREIVQSEGWSGLWRGNQARMLKVAPSCAIMLSSYELGKRLLEE